MDKINSVCIVGGGGFVGSCLVPYLLANNYTVRVLDLFLYGEYLPMHDKLDVIHGDLRNAEILKRSFVGMDAVIDLACISNDPSFELNPDLGKSINYDAFGPMVDVAKDSGIKRFVYASSSSVYGIQDAERVTEELPLKPLTDYSKYKALAEDVLHTKRSTGFSIVILRPATISGYSPRFRMDVVANTLICQALQNRSIRILGGQQKRANLFMRDMCETYREALMFPDETVDGKVYNIGAENNRLIDLADKIKLKLGNDISINVESTNDQRSYSLCSDKIAAEWGFVPSFNLDDAIDNLRIAYAAGKISDPVNNPSYYNVKCLQKAGLK